MRPIKLEPRVNQNQDDPQQIFLDLLPHYALEETARESILRRLNVAEYVGQPITPELLEAVTMLLQRLVYDLMGAGELQWSSSLDRWVLTPKWTVLAVSFGDRTVRKALPVVFLNPGQWALLLPDGRALALNAQQVWRSEDEALAKCKG